MKVKCWGARGSLPVSGPEYARYGGSTTCMEVRSKNGDVIIVDAGTGIRKLGNVLAGEQISRMTMLFTHAHWDHIMGFPFFRPIYMKQTHINVFGCSFVQDSVRDILKATMIGPYFPVDFAFVQSALHFHGECRDYLEVGGIKIEPIALNHPNQGMGFKFTEDGKSFVFLTDNELGHEHYGGLKFEDYAAFSQGADLLIHDAEYRPEEYKATRSWGHSTYTDALKLALEAKVKCFGLFHHNVERSDQDLDKMVAHSNEVTAQAGGRLNCFALSEGMELEL